MMQLIFFAASFLVVLAGHFFLWFILVRILEITSPTYQVILGIILFGLFISTLVASLIIHRWDNLFTRWYYILTGFWVGMLVNFGLALVLVIVLKWLIPAVGWNISLGSLRLIFFSIALGLSGWGAYNAWQPKLTDYTVYIKDLPVAWQNKTVVQISDIHLGPVYRQHFFTRLVAQIQAIHPEAVFITGDLFDGMEANFDWLSKPFAELSAPRGLYYSFGNHDLYLGFSHIKELLKEPVQVLDNRLVVVDGLQIIGLSYAFDKDFDLEKEILEQAGYNPEQPSILLFHEPKNVVLAKEAGIDLQLSGHTHRGQLFPLNWLVQLIYKGYGYGLSRLGDFSLIVSNGVGTWGPPMRTSGRGEIVLINLQKK